MNEQMKYFQQAKNIYWRFMDIINNRCSEEREKRSGIISFLKNQEVNGLVVCPSSQQFNIKTIKRYFCQNVLELSWREDITIKQYDDFFNESEYKRKNGISIGAIIEILDEEKNMEIYSKIISFLGTESVLEGWTPCVLLDKLRKLSYETYLKYVSVEVDLCSAESTKKKKKCYLNFLSSFVLFHVFWEEMGMIEYSHYVEDFSDETTDSNLAWPELRSLSEAPKLVKALTCNIMCMDVKRFYLSPLAALWGLVICTEFLSLRELTVDKRFSKKYDMHKLFMLMKDEMFKKMILYVEEFEKNNTKKYTQFDEMAGKTDLVKILLGKQDTLIKVREDISNYLEWMEENYGINEPLPLSMAEMKLVFYLVPEGIMLLQEKLAEIEEENHHNSSVMVL